MNRELFEALFWAVTVAAMKSQDKRAIDRAIDALERLEHEVAARERFLMGPQSEAPLQMSDAVTAMRRMG